MFNPLNIKKIVSLPLKNDIFYSFFLKEKSSLISKTRLNLIIVPKDILIKQYILARWDKEVYVMKISINWLF
jgi:hypothetical protein